MPILSHSKENEVEDGNTERSLRFSLDQFFGGAIRGCRGLIFASNPVYAFIGYGQRRNQILAHQMIVAFGMIRRNAALICKKELDLVQRTVGILSLACNFLEKSRSYAAPGKRADLPIRSQNTKPILGSGSGQIGIVFELDYFEGSHSTSSPHSRSSSASRSKGSPTTLL